MTSRQRQSYLPFGTPLGKRARRSPQMAPGMVEWSAEESDEDALVLDRESGSDDEEDLTPAETAVLATAAVAPAQAATPLAATKTVATRKSTHRLQCDEVTCLVVALYELSADDIFNHQTQTMKWHKVFEQVNKHPELTVNVPWFNLADKDKTMQTLKNKTKALAKFLCCRAEGTNLSFSGGGLSHDVIARLVKVKELLGATIMANSLSVKRARKQEQLFAQVRDFWENLQQKVVLTQRWVFSQSYRLDQLKKLIKKCQNPDLFVVPDDIRPNEELLARLFQFQTRKQDMLTDDELDTIFGDFGIAVHPIAEETVKSGKKMYHEMGLTTNLHISTEHLSRITETEKLLEEEANEQRDLLHEMLEVMKKQQEVLQEMSIEMKAIHKEVAELRDELTKQVRSS